MLRKISEGDAWVTNEDGDIIGIQLHGRSETVDLSNPVNGKVNPVTGVVKNIVGNQLAPTIPGVYNLDPAHMRKWRKAVANVRAGTGHARLAMAGDSTVRGAMSSPSWSGGQAVSVVRRLTQMLNSYFAPARDDSTFGDGGMGNAAFDTYDARVSRGVWASHGSLKTAGGAVIKSAGGAGSGYAFTPIGAWDKAEIYLAKYVYSKNGNAGVLIDGSNPVEGATSVATNGATELVKTTVTAASVGTHTITVNQDSRSTYETNLMGIRCYNSAAPHIMVDNLGWGSSKPSDWLISTPWPWEPLPMLAALAPDLTVFECTINPIFAGIDAATWAAQVQQVITTAKTTGDCIIVIGNPTETGETYHAGLDDQYFQAALTLAINNNCPLIDMRHQWLNSATAYSLGYLQADKVHGTASGYADKAQTYFRALTF